MASGRCKDVMGQCTNLLQEWDKYVSNSQRISDLLLYLGSGSQQRETGGDTPSISVRLKEETWMNFGTGGWDGHRTQI